MKRERDTFKALAFVKALLAYSAVAYGADVLVRPAIIARRAKKAAEARGKPMVNVGAGTPNSSLRAALLGPTLWGDVNIDIASDNPVCSAANVCWGDAHLLPYQDKTFGSLVASHVLEHMDDPQAALAEWSRVADEVFIIVPAWWAPHTWLHPGHQWFIEEIGGQITKQQRLFQPRGRSRLSSCL